MSVFTALDLVTALRERGWTCTDPVTIPDRRSRGEQFTVTVEDDTITIRVKPRGVELCPTRDWSSPYLHHHAQLAEHVAAWLDEVRQRRVTAQAELRVEQWRAERMARASRASTGGVTVVVQAVGFRVTVDGVTDEKLDVVMAAIRGSLDESKVIHDQ